MPGQPGTVGRSVEWGDQSQREDQHSLSSRRRLRHQRSEESPLDQRDTVIVGGGIIGLTIAWRLAGRGQTVTVIDPQPGRGASWVAGGMLAPVTEAWPGDEAVLELGSQALRGWPDFAAQVAADGVDVRLHRHGTVLVGQDPGDDEQLDVLAAYLTSIGRTPERVSGRRLRALVPGLGGGVRRGLSVPDDLAVDNRDLLTGLERACDARGVEWVDETATAVRTDGVDTASQTVLADTVVVAAGAWSARLCPELGEAVRPLKGEILRLRARRGCVPPPERTVRAVVEGRPLYLVPRCDGELVIGATQYEAGYDTTVTSGAVRMLLADAERILPGVVDYELAECAAGLRAASADNLPYVGWLSDGVLAAAGHHRNGLLLAPLTAETVLCLLEGNEPPAYADVMDPARLRKEVNV